MRPSSTTDIRVIGGGNINGSVDAISLISEPNDGHELVLSNAESGLWEFDFAFRDIVFEDFQIQHADDA